MRQVVKDKKTKLKKIATTVAMFLVLITPLSIGAVSAVSPSPNAVDRQQQQQQQNQKYCGDGDQKVKISLDIGCRGEGGGIMNPITDAIFAIIRFLSLGVGLIIVASITFAGIQYTSSRGDPKATADAISRIKSNVIAFLIYVFSFAILNYLIPQGFIG